MTKAVYLIGPPGVGKSTLMAGLTAEYLTGDPVKVPCHKGKTPLVYEPLRSRHAGRLVGVRLGITRPQFAGTDALGMSVNPQAITWAQAQGQYGDLDVTIWGEGQRLANMPFLTALHHSSDLTVLYLKAHPLTLDARCNQRGSNQSLAWRKAANTRVVNLADRLQTEGIRCVALDAGQRAEKVLKLAQEVLR